MNLDKLTEIQKLMAFKNKYYDNQKWQPQKGDYYTTTREDLELYQIVDITEDKILTKYCLKERGNNISEWDKETFLTKDFGLKRMHVPNWILVKY